jgi:hypothetical protein
LFNDTAATLKWSLHIRLKYYPRLNYLLRKYQSLLYTSVPSTPQFFSPLSTPVSNVRRCSTGKQDDYGPKEGNSESKEKARLWTEGLERTMMWSCLPLSFPWTWNSLPCMSKAFPTHHLDCFPRKLSLFKTSTNITWCCSLLVLLTEANRHIKCQGKEKRNH